MAFNGIRRDWRAAAPTRLQVLPGAPAQSLVGAGQLAGSYGQAMTFSRAAVKVIQPTPSTAQTVGSGLPAVAPQGLLIENAHDNRLLASGDVSNGTYWGSSNSGAAAPTVTGNYTTAPDGTLTATRLQIPAVTSGQTSARIQSLLVTMVGWTFSVWVRAVTPGAQTYLYLINTVDGTVSAFTLITPTSAWQRYTVTGTLSAVIWAVGIGTRVPGGMAPQGAADIAVWGAQVEPSVYAHSYVPTTTVIVTQPADIASFPAAVMPVSSGSVSLNFTPEWGTSPPSGGAFLVDSRGDVSPNTKGVSLSVNASRQMVAAIGTTTVATSSALTWNIGQTYSVALTWGNTNVAIIRDGVVVASATGVTMPTVHANLNVGDGRLGTGAFAADGFISNLTVAG